MHLYSASQSELRPEALPARETQENRVVGLIKLWRKPFNFV